VLLTDGTNKLRGALWLQQTSHVLDGQHVNIQSDKLFDEFKVVLQVVHSIVRVANISRVANGSFSNTSGGSDGINTELHVLNIVDRIEDTEHIHTSILGELAELVHYGTNNEIRQQR